MKELLELAVSKIGVKEISGAIHNDEIIQYAHESGFTWINDDETPWCSVFMNWLAMKCDLPRSKSAAARSWLEVGISVRQKYEIGDTVVLWRTSPESDNGHVGLFMGFTEDGCYVFVLGGNQGNAVNISMYAAERILDIRRLEEEILELPEEKFMSIGSKGPSVKSLQKILKDKGYNPGPVDGIFGMGTRKALMMFQKDNALRIDGIYGPKTKAKL